MEVLFERLKNLIQSNTDLIDAVLKNSANKLLENLDSLKDFVQEVKVEGNNEEILVKKVREVISGAEYDIEEFINCALQYKRGRYPTKLPDEMVHLALNARDTAKNIETLAAVVQKFQQYRSESDLGPLRDIRITRRSQMMDMDLMMKEDRMVGFDRELNEVIELLNGGSDKQETISIFGVHGIGKTTFAKRLFNDLRIELFFCHRVFISVSQEYRPKDIFLEVLEAIDPLTRGSYNSVSDDELIQLVYQSLEHVRYLIVLDDVREEKVWYDLKLAFPDQNNRSRVLITTQIESVAWHADPKSKPYFLRPLNLDESRELFRREVFGDFRCRTELENYESQILEGCCGLPLAVVQVAGFLQDKRDDINIWRQVAGKVKDYVSIGPNQSFSKIDMVRLSFSQLPPYLQDCFLYLGIFPEVSEIPVWNLLQLWIAEDLIQQSGNLSLEDEAEGYLEELVQRNLVMVGQKKTNGQIKTCRINPTVRKFCKTQSGNINLFKEIERCKTNLLLHSCHRLCINSDLLEEYLLRGPQGKSTRSFLCFLTGELATQPDLISSLTKTFPHLSVLDARSIPFPDFPRDILDLYRLKYLAIAGIFKFLPQDFTTLSNLQTLIVETSSSTLEIKANILKMKSLRHVHITASTSLTGEEEPPVNASLQTLSTISPETCKKNVLNRTPRLKRLGVRGKLATLLGPDSEACWSNSISKLELLESLKLLNDDTTSNLHVLPREKEFPSKLKKLTLLNTMLDWKNMATLAKLENLEVLKLKKNAFRGRSWKTEDWGFRRLKILHLEIEDLVVWKASASHFPMLTCLFLRHCSNLDNLPHELAYFPRLRMIDLYYTNPKVVLFCRKIAQLRLLLQQDIYLKDAHNSGLVLSIYPPDDVMSNREVISNADANSMPMTGVESHANVQGEGPNWRRGKSLIGRVRQIIPDLIRGCAR